MRGVTRSFWVLVAIAAAVEGLLVYLAIASGIDPGQTVAIRDLRTRIE